jgi:hypothetical protein
MQNFIVVLSSGVFKITAANSESAAWSAKELSINENSELIDVYYEEEWI